MDSKHKIIVAGAIGAAALVGFFAWKKYGGAFGASGSTDANTPVASSASFTPVANSYSAIPIGATTGSNAAPPPGVPAAQVTTQTGHGNADVADDEYDPRHHANSAQQQYTSATGGQASIPTGSVSSVNTAAGNAALIDMEYMKVFGRHAEQAGLDFWTKAMGNGDVTTSSLERDLIRGAQGADIGAALTRDPARFVSSYTPK